MLNVDSIDVFYGEIQALWNVSFDVKEGEVVSLIGANGAGKSTTIKALVGQLRPRKGSIEFLGERIDKLPAFKIPDKGIAWIPEGRRLFGNMTVLENLKIGAYSKSARAKLVDSLDRVYQLFPVLKERRNQLASTLSGGEQQMLAIARALMSRPRLLVADELTLGLGPRIISDLFKAIIELNKQGLTILLVEQNVKHALETSNRSYVLENGRVKFSGKSDELLGTDEIKKAYLGL